MVRIKHRWLLVQILYPSSKPQLSTASREEKPKPSLLGPVSPTLSLHSPTPDSINQQTILRLLRAQITQLFGDYGGGVASGTLQVKYWSNATSTFIVRCERAAFRLAWAAITFVLRVSGTIRKCEEELIRRAKALCGRVKGIAVASQAGLGSDGVIEVTDDEDEFKSGDPKAVDDEEDEDEDDEMDAT